MKKTNPTVISETKYIAVVTGILSVLMQSVFLIIGKWDYKVVISNLYSAFFVVLNFYLMALSVVKAVNKDGSEAQKVMKTSLSLRTFMLFAAIAIGVLLPVFNIFAVIIPLFFVRIAVFLRPFFKGYDKSEKGDKDERE